MVTHNAESARGVSPRAAHRSGRESLDSSGSCHPPKAAAFCQGKEFLRLPVDSNSTWMTCPLRSVGITPLLHYYETVRPCPADPFFRPHGASVLPYVHRVCERAGLRCTSRYRCTGWGLPLLLQRRRPEVFGLRDCIPVPHVPLSTLRRRSCERLRMTRGRCGSRIHIRMTFAFTTPRRFNRRTGEDPCSFPDIFRF